MQSAELINNGDTQAVRLPEGIRFPGDSVSIRREGEAVILEPLLAKAWPDGFFESIRIDDPAFTRPAQAPLPPAPTLDSDS